MIFTSFNFLIFFPIVVVLFYITPVKFRWLTLLVVSYFFYINLNPVFILLVAGITLSTYIFTLLMDKTPSDAKKRTLMQINIVLILLPLFFFKYFGVINESIFALLEKFNLRWPLPEFKLMLPIGISYYTFMAIGYTVDVYNEKIEAEKNIGILALFISFFPLILSGPIERAENMIPQFKKMDNFSSKMFNEGAKYILWGYFMKLVVADRLGIYVNAVYGNIEHHSGVSLLIATIFYTFQMYADLGGYSLIAIGIARILGINVMHNFNRPFCATSMSAFWRRWHISLISWLTDYIYTPLSFSLRKYGKWGIVMALMVTFLLSGIWHGPVWAFFVWGLLQGTFLSIEALTNRQKIELEKKYNLPQKKWYVFFGIIFTFILFAGSEVFGAVEDVSTSLLVFKKIFTDFGSLFIGSPKNFILGFLGIAVLLFKDFTEEFMPDKFLLLESNKKFVRIMSFSIVVILILLIGVFDGGQFIYFKY